MSIGRLLLLAILCPLLPLLAQEGPPTRQVLDFEGLSELPADWELEGAVALDRRSGFNSAQSLRISREPAPVEVPTRLMMASFAAAPGVWEIRTDHQSDLDSPDLSFNATLELEALDATGTMLRGFEVLVVSGKQGWTASSKQLVLPKGTASARFRLALAKATGSLRLDNLVAAFVAPAPETVFAAIKLAPRAYGSLFYPGDPVGFDVTVECAEPWTGSEQRLEVAITDYWGAEQMEPFSVALEPVPGQSHWRGTIDLSAGPWEDGKYYELRVRASASTDDSHRETSAFAILPRPVTKDYRPHEIPFTLNNWDDRIKDTFFMADRIGIRWKLLWSGWNAEPPYEPYAPGIDWIEELDMGAMLGVRPVVNIEKHRDGYQVWTEEALRQGAYNMVMAYKDRVPLMIRCGNEPHTDPAVVKDAVAAYRAVYEGVKAADPSIFFIGTSIGPHEAFFEQGFHQYLDAFDYHTYSGWKRLRDITDGYRTMFETYQVEPKPIFCTEIGLNSQGMARIDVARDMVKKFAIHFAEGHQNLAWFDLLYPDPKGTIAGSNGEAFNVFNAKYSLYSPKITAVTYYNLVNGICIKDAVEERIYPEEIEAILFRDVEDRCLLVLWNELGRRDAFVPLPGVGQTRLIRIDGSQTLLDAGGEGLSLSLSQDPLLLFFDSAELRLAESLQPPRLALRGELPTIVKGSSASLELALEGLGAEDLVASAPYGWELAIEPAAAGSARLRVRAPERTAATEGRIVVQARDGSGELSLPLPVAGKLELRILPQPFTDGAAGVRLELANNGEQDESVRYEIELPEAVAMEDGTFHTSHATPFAAAFTASNSGELVLAAGERSVIELPIADLDPKTIYRARASLVDSAGERVECERFLSGFVPVPKLAASLSLDPAQDAAAWARARPLRVDEAKQYRRYRQKSEPAAWTGPEDLSATLRFLWDDRYLYLRADVADEAYHHAERDDRLWAMDGLQLLVDPNRESAAKSGYHDLSMGQGAAGDQAWCHSSAHPTVQAGAAPEILVRTTPASDGSGGRTQIVAIPWSRLAPFAPAAGRNLGMAVILNEDDGDGRGSFMGWFGCVHSKQLDLVGDLVLVE